MTQDEVRGRIEAFVADFHTRWQRSGRSPGMVAFDPGAFQAWPGELAGMVAFDPGAFEAWATELADLAAIHCTPGFRTGQEGALSSSPAHDPSAEQITDIEVDEETSTARSVIQTVGNTTYYYEYRLLRGDDGWRISQLSTFLDPPGTPLIDPARAEALMQSATPEAALPDLPAHLELNVPGLFTTGRVVAPFGKPVPLEVFHLGKLTCASGVLTVLDLGSIDAHVVPLARRITPGTYAVEVATAADVTVAVRLLLSEAPAVSWHPAEFTNGTHGVGVDAGNVALVDVGSLVECEAQHIEAIFQEHVERLMETPGTMFCLTGEVVDAVMVTSGYGDGTYPCYWGLAADGSLTSFVVDFRVLAENILRTSRVPFQPGPVSTPELTGHELQITANDGSFVVSSSGEAITGLRVLAPDGAVLLDGDQLGTFITGGISSKTWNPDALPPPGSVLEVTEYLGYRHI
jgi:voltage-gated potassium channel Kch